MLKITSANLLNDSPFEIVKPTIYGQYRCVECQKVIPINEYAYRLKDDLSRVLCAEHADEDASANNNNQENQDQNNINVTNNVPMENVMQQ